jgi:uncharacterized protein (TIRG00374 family)
MSTETLPTINPSLKKFIVFPAFIGYAALVLYLFYVVGFGQLLVVLQTVNIGIYALAIGSVVISLTFHTLVWFQLLNSLSIRLSFRKTYLLYWVGVFVDNLIPGGWSGDLFKAYLLNKDPSVQSGKAVASVVAKNMYEAIFNLANMIIGLVLLMLNYTLEGSILIAIGGIMMLLTLPLIILLVVSFKLEGAKRAIAALFRLLRRVGEKRWRLDDLQGKINKALGDYHEGMKILVNNPKMLFKPMVLSFFAWGFEIITLLFVFAALGQLIPPDKVIIVRSIAGNVEAQGYAFVGYAQIISSEIYKALGVPFVMGASVALLGGVVIFWFKTGVSYAAFHYTLFYKRTRNIRTNNDKTESNDVTESKVQKAGQDDFQNAGS